MEPDGPRRPDVPYRQRDCLVAWVRGALFEHVNLGLYLFRSRGFLMTR